MKHWIDKTAEQFANEVRKRMIEFSYEGNRDFYIDKVIKENWPDFDREYVLINLSLNTVHNKLDAMDRDANRNLTGWQESKQMSLFNNPKFSMPKWMWIGKEKKPYREVSLKDGREYINGFFEQIQKEADGLEEAWKAKKRKADMVAETLWNIDNLIDKAIKSGYDPEKLTFAEVEDGTFKENSRTSLEVV